MCNNKSVEDQLVKVISDTTRRVPYNRLTFYPNREVRNQFFRGRKAPNKNVYKTSNTMMLRTFFFMEKF